MNMQDLQNTRDNFSRYDRNVSNWKKQQARNLYELYAPLSNVFNSFLTKIYFLSSYSLRITTN